MGLEQYKGDMAMCCRCSACKFVPMQKVSGYKYANVCPSISRYDFHSYSGGGRMNIGAAALRNGMNYTDKLLDIVYNCQMCGACGVSCNYAMDMEVMAPITEFRIKCVADGKTHPALDKVIDRLRKQDSMVPVTGKRGDWTAGLQLKDATKDEVDVLYYVGCLTSYDKSLQKLARITAGLLKKAGINFGIAGNAEPSSGGAAYEMGYEQDFLNQANKTMSLIRKTGVKTVVTSSAGDYQAIKVLYDKFKLKGELEVLHIAELIPQLVKEGRLKPRKSVNLSVTYHDPCHLGRLSEAWVHWEGKKVPGDRFVFDPPKTYRRGTNGVYEEPREVLKSIPGITLTEMPRIKEYAWCCGAGGGVSDSNPEFAQWTAKERIEEAESTGAEALVSTCPKCEKTFREAVEATGSRLKVYDIVELFEQSIE
ncbi:MAG: (Fe-S)-binding protein [Pseudomonadota bacterium]|nr:(Fe-S)-binding protein [Pseudomonadota bacterium]